MNTCTTQVRGLVFGSGVCFWFGGLQVLYARRFPRYQACDFSYMHCGNGCVCNVAGTGLRVAHSSTITALLHAAGVHIAITADVPLMIDGSLMDH